MRKLLLAARYFRSAGTGRFATQETFLTVRYKDIGREIRNVKVHNCYFPPAFLCHVCYCSLFLSSYKATMPKGQARNIFDSVNPTDLALIVKKVVL